MMTVIGLLHDNGHYQRHKDDGDDDEDDYD